MKAVDNAIAEYLKPDRMAMRQIIERACLEAQLELLKGIVSASNADFHKRKFGTYKMALIVHTDKAFHEIEAKLKAMK
jgi:hypothetical protein